MSDENEAPEFVPFNLEGMFEEDAKTFSNIDDFIAWIDHEQNAWSWMNVPAKQLTAVPTATIAKLNSLKILARDLPNGNDQQQKNARTTLDAELQRWKVECGITSSSMFGQVVNQIADNDQETALAALHFMVSGHAGLNSPTAVIGAVVVTSFKLGLLSDEAKHANIHAHKAMDVNWSQLHENATKDWGQHCKTLDVKLNSIDNALSKFSENHEERINATSEELDQFKTLCREDIALRSPVAYWDTRAKKHYVKASDLRKLFIYSSVIAAGLVCTFAYVYIHPHLADASGKGASQLWRVAMLFGVIGAAAWPLRIINKVWMSHLHLATDAEERATMIKTYLSMLEAETVSDAHRALILPSLFRSSPTGIIRDDGGPSLQIDAVTKAMRSDG